MDWQTAIDIKIWEDKNCSLLDDLLSFAKGKNWVSVLFSDRLFNMVSPEYIWLVYKNLQQVKRSNYNCIPQGTEIALSPDLTAALNETEKAETEGMAFSFLQTVEPPHKVYALRANRNSTNATTLGIQGISSKNIPLLTIEASDGLKQFLDAHEPKLAQAKHIAQLERNIGGEVASKFSAWDPRHSEYAESLLKKAYDESGARLLPPNELFVWDKKNEKYVRFMHSGNWEYHGHDFEEYNRIPDEVKRRYNHWKK